MCKSYSCEETRQKGGYVSFNMTFCERGKPIAADVQQATQSTVTTAATELSTATTTGRFGNSNSRQRRRARSRAVLDGGRRVYVELQLNEAR